MLEARISLPCWATWDAVESIRDSLSGVVLEHGLDLCSVSIGPTAELGIDIQGKVTRKKKEAAIDSLVFVTRSALEYGKYKQGKIRTNG